MALAPPWRPYDPPDVPPSARAAFVARAHADFVFFLEHCWPCNAVEAEEWTHFGVSGDWWVMGVLGRILQHHVGNNMILKSRGDGGSTIMQAKLAWRALRAPLRSGVASYKDDQAKYFLGELNASLAVLRERMPWFMPAPDPGVHCTRIPHARGLLSEIHSFPHSKDTARGMNLGYCVLDELSAWEFAAEAMVSVNGAVINRGGTVDVVFTPKAGTESERMALEADLCTPPIPDDSPWWPGKTDLNGVPIPFKRRQWFRRFLERVGWDGAKATKPYPINPESKYLLLKPHWSYKGFRDEAWAMDKFNMLGRRIPDWCAEYELSADAASLHVFDADDLAANFRDADPEGRFRKGWSYSIGSDPATAHGGHATIFAGALDELGRPQGIVKWFDEPVDEAALAHLWAKWVQEALDAGVRSVLLVPENNLSGALAMFCDVYPHLVPCILRGEDAMAQHNRQSPALKKPGAPKSAIAKLGVNTQERTKKQMIAASQQLLALRNAPLPRIAPLRYQLRRLQYDNGKAVAPPGERTDCAMGWMMMNLGLIALNPRLLTGAGMPAQEGGRIAAPARPAYDEEDYLSPATARDPLKGNLLGSQERPNHRWPA